MWDGAGAHDQRSSETNAVSRPKMNCVVVVILVWDGAGAHELRVEFTSAPGGSAPTETMQNAVNVAHCTSSS